MSELHEPAVERILSPVDGAGKLSIFKAMIADAEELGTDVSQVCMPYIQDGDEFVEGTWLPELWMVVRKVLPEEGA